MRADLARDWHHDRSRRCRVYSDDQAAGSEPQHGLVHHDRKYLLELFQPPVVERLDQHHQHFLHTPFCVIVSFIVIFSFVFVLVILFAPFHSLIHVPGQP